MYLKKEALIIIGIILTCLIGLSINNSNNEKESNQNILNQIVINIDGEVVRKTRLIYQKPLTYGVLLLRIKNICNDYSDLSGFKHSEVIYKSVNITIPTIDINNNQKNVFININTASKEELMMLPQIGEKRSQKIIAYRNEIGIIQTWDVLWSIIGVSDEVKKLIIKQASL